MSFLNPQFVLAIVFVALYVLATYSPPAPGSPRYKADIFLCALFAGEYVHRMLVRRGDALRCAGLRLTMLQGSASSCTSCLP